MDCSAFTELQTSSKRRLSPVYSAPRAVELRRRQKSRASRKGHAGDPWGSSTGNVLVRGQQKFIETGSRYVVQAGLKLLSSSDLPSSASQSTGIPGAICNSTFKYNRMARHSGSRLSSQHSGRLRQVDHLRSGVQDQSGQHGETPSLLKIQKISQAWWQVPVIPASWEAEAGESFEPRRQRLQIVLKSRDVSLYCPFHVTCCYQGGCQVNITIDEIRVLLQSYHIGQVQGLMPVIPVLWEVKHNVHKQ
ncbi:hypothetical protein AAY473_039943 [Plecturocebus cupreus]